MDQYLAIVVMTLSYLAMLIPQLRLVRYKYDPHIGNFTSTRIAGHGLGSIFFRHNFGVPIPALSFALQYDRFGRDYGKYVICHAALASGAAPLVFLFARELTGNPWIAAVASLIYVIAFHAPVVGNWLIQSEHYENLFFLAGGALILAADGSPLLSALGALLLGCTLLCKFPALLSLWLLIVLAVREYSAGGLYPLEVILPCYLAPFLLFMAGGRVAREERTGEQGGEGKSRDGFLRTLKEVPARYLYFYRRDPKGYLAAHVRYHLAGTARQLLPVLILAAAYFLFGTDGEKWVLGLGLAVTSLIFILRMTFAVAFSFYPVLCIAAGAAFFTVPQGLLLPLCALVLVSGGYALFTIGKAAPVGCFGDPVRRTVEDVIADYVREQSEPGDPFFCNINKSMAYLYTLSERALPCHTTFLTIGGYGPWIDHCAVPAVIEKEGRDLLAGIAHSPPRFILQSVGDAPILNLSAVESACALSYGVVATIESYVLYRLEGRRAGAGGRRVDVQALFNAVQGVSETRSAAEHFLRQLEGAPKPGVPVPELERQAPAARPPSETQAAPPLALFLDTCDPGGLERIYRETPGLASLPYDEQLRALHAAKAGKSALYAGALAGAGWHAADLMVNCRELQLAWARERGLHCTELLPILLEQIKRIGPAVLYLLDPFIATAEIVRQMRRCAQLLVIEVGREIPRHIDLSAFDVVFAALPEVAESLRREGIAAYHLIPPFDPAPVLTAAPYQRRFIDASFVGEVTPSDPAGGVLLEHLAERTPLLWWGRGAEGLPEGSAARTRHQGDADASGLLHVVRNSRIAVQHGAGEAAAAGLFEITGAGTLLVTGYREELRQLFEVGVEVVAYRSPEECAKLVNYYLAHPEEAEVIARAGRERTLQTHTHAGRMAQAAAILEGQLRSLSGDGKEPAPPAATPESHGERYV